MTSPNGTGFYYVDWAPGAVFPLHRTMSLDYLIVLSGELELSFEDGTATTIRPGDTVIQRGAEHIWKNTTDEWTRTAIVMIGAEPHIVDGEPVPATLT
ncbi:MAG: cupin domain-containing protein [Gordonia sp. (in: high G+C Gram-positive bacteria)]|uniref:cupin domain-containing protein n=1 Tax=Gordonia sp. (in: high G+C Gram-positive bacteria) TaxID=84139 RepID=UPI0039E38808